MWDVHDRAAVAPCQRSAIAGPKLRAAYLIVHHLGFLRLLLSKKVLSSYSKTADCEISVNGLLKLFKAIPLNKRNSLFSPNWVIGFFSSISSHICLFSVFAVSINCGEKNHTKCPGS